MTQEHLLTLVNAGLCCGGLAVGLVLGFVFSVLRNRFARKPIKD